MSSLYTYNPICLYISQYTHDTFPGTYTDMDETSSHRGRKSCWLILGRKDETTRMVVLVVSGWMRWV